MKISKKLAAFTVAGAVIVSLVGVSQAAQAALIPSSSITITPVTGSATADPFLSTLTTNAACPAGSVASVTSVYQGGVRLGNVSNVRTTTTPNTGNTYGEFGFGAAPISLNRIQSATNDYLTNKTLSAVPGIAPGQFDLRVFCFTSTTTFDYANAPFFSLPMQLVAGVWSLYTAPPAAAATTTSLTASASGSNVTLVATVSPAGIAGEFEFYENGVPITDVTGINGVGTATLAGVSNGQHIYTAKFISSNTALYLDSPLSGTATVQVGGVQAQSFVNVTIPNNVGALTLTGVSASVNLGTAVYNSTTNTLDATSVSPLVAKVTDTRQLDFPAWSLTGQVGDFNNGSTALLGKYLGWTPSVTGVGTAGAVVAPAPGTANGIASISQLAFGAPTTAGTVTDASAVLLLKAPSNTPQGSYAALLTLTLI